MKSNSDTKWSEEDVDELLTSFFRTEVAVGLQGSTPSLVSPAERVPVSVPPRTEAKWKNAVMAGCIAALLIAAAGVFQFGGDDANEPQPGNGGMAAAPLVDGDEPIPVNSTDQDEGDLSVPEQDIEFLSDDE